MPVWETSHGLCRRDAWSLADALRVDGHGWKALAKEDPLVAELRLLCRDEVALIEEPTALINQLPRAPCANIIRRLCRLFTKERAGCQNRGSENTISKYCDLA